MDILNDFGLNVELLIWGAIIVLSIILEMGTVALVAVWFVFGAAAAFISAYCGQPFLYQSYWFVGVSATLFLLIRPLAGNLKGPKVATNTDALIGQTAMVCSEIDLLRGTGRIEIQGLTWSAKPSQGNSIPAGTTVKIDKIEGVTLFVSPCAK